MKRIQGRKGQWGPSRQNQARSHSFSRAELVEIAKGYAAITFAFAILLLGGFAMFTAKPGELVIAMAISGVTVGAGFIVHELAHRYVARQYGCQAFFKAFDPFLVVAIVSAFFGFIFAAPGAVVIQGYTSREKTGKIAAAGPLSNIVLALLFLGLKLINPIAWLEPLFFYGVWINGFLAFFNLLPFGNFDGLKVLMWSRSAFYKLMGASLVVLFLPKLF